MSVSGELPTVVRFGMFEADLRSGELRKKGLRVKIQDLPFRTLILLLSRPNQVVTREEFRQALWPQDVFVDFDRGISSAIKRLRDALGDSADNPTAVAIVGFRLCTFPKRFRGEGKSRKKQFCLKRRCRQVFFHGKG